MTTASTNRNPAAVNGVVGSAVTKLSSVTLSFTPFPADIETVQRLKLESPRKLYVTGVHGTPPDIAEGDLMTVDSVEYVIREVGKWTAPVGYTKIYMELVR